MYLIRFTLAEVFYGPALNFGTFLWVTITLYCGFVALVFSYTNGRCAFI